MSTSDPIQIPIQSQNRIIRFSQRQIQQIREGGWPVLFRKVFILSRKLARLATLPFALSVVLAIRLLRPWIVIRFGQLRGERIGHFTANTEIYLCERDIGMDVPRQGCVDIVCCSKPVCNRQLRKMWHRILHIWPAAVVVPIERLNCLLPGGEVHAIACITNGGRDVHNALEGASPHLSFSPEEEKEGIDGLRSLGVPEDTPFVCFHTRDSAYLETIYSDPNMPFCYHSYRDSSIQNLVPAVEQLTKRGYYAIRMGVVVKEALQTSNPKIIDYATNDQRNDFMDIYLGANCTFFISTGSGIDGVPQIFRRPYIYVNFVPLEYAHSWIANHLFIPKKYWLCTEHRFMTFREILESGTGRFLSSQLFKKMDIELIENTPEEIAALALEMDARLKGIWQKREEEEELQHRFWAFFSKSELHGEFRSRIGADFLRQHCEWLE